MSQRHPGILLAKYPGPQEAWAMLVRAHCCNPKVPDKTSFFRDDVGSIYFLDCSPGVLTLLLAKAQDDVRMQNVTDAMNGLPSRSFEAMVVWG